METREIWRMFMDAAEVGLGKLRRRNCLGSTLLNYSTISGKTRRLNSSVNEEKET